MSYNKRINKYYNYWLNFKIIKQTCKMMTTKINYSFRLLIQNKIKFLLKYLVVKMNKEK